MLSSGELTGKNWKTERSSHLSSPKWWVRGQTCPLPHVSVGMLSCGVRVVLAWWCSKSAKTGNFDGGWAIWKSANVLAACSITQCCLLFVKKSHSGWSPDWTFMHCMRCWKEHTRLAYSHQLPEACGKCHSRLSPLNSVQSQWLKVSELLNSLLSALCSPGTYIPQPRVTEPRSAEFAGMVPDLFYMSITVLHTCICRNILEIQTSVLSARTNCIAQFEELHLLTQKFFQHVLHFIDRQKQIICTQEYKLSGTAINCYVLTSNLSSLTLFTLQLRCVTVSSTAGIGSLLCALIYLSIQTC